MGIWFDLRLKKKIFSNSRNLPTEKNGLFFKGTSEKIIILVHGLTGAPYETGFLAKFLQRAGYSVFCPRLANHGESIDVLKRTTWQECYESVERAFLEVESSHPNTQVFVSGLSIGALLVLLLAEKFPERISGVSCLSPTLFYDGWNSPWSRHLLPLAYMSPLKNFFYFKEEPPYGIKNETIRKRIHEYYKQASLDDMKEVGRYGYPFYPLTLLYQHDQLVKHLLKKLPLIKTPVQLIQAQDDDMTSVKNSQFIHDRIKSEIKEIVLLYDSYHVITSDQERETVAKEVARFFGHLKNPKCRL